MIVLSSLSSHASEVIRRYLTEIESVPRCSIGWHSWPWWWRWSGFKSCCLQSTFYFLSAFLFQKLPWSRYDLDSRRRNKAIFCHCGMTPSTFYAAGESATSTAVAQGKYSQSHMIIVTVNGPKIRKHLTKIS